MTKPISKWILIRAFVLTVVVFSLLTRVNNGGVNTDRGEIESENAPGAGGRALTREARKTLLSNPAEIKFSYEKRKSFRGSASKRSALVSERAVHTIVEELKKRIALPFEIKVVYAGCGGPDSYYDEDSHEIVVCYELIDDYYYLFSRTLKGRTAQSEAAKGATVSMFLHEVGHALIAGWDLPITGREEDAADQFSTLLLINDVPDGEEMALNGACAFKLLANLDKGNEKDYSDPHSLDEQRFFDTICLVYGHRPEKYQYLVKNGTLTADRAAECGETYDRLNKSWRTLLAPHHQTD